MIQTFATYCLADALSNFIQHPTQKMDYGAVNQLLGREVDSQFWGTRTQHIFGVAACLAATDHGSQALFSKFLGTKNFSFARHPAAFVGHTVGFIGIGVMIYVGVDAVANPSHKAGERLVHVKSETYNTIRGSCTSWFEPYVPVAIAQAGLPKIANGWLGGALIPATLAYATVKGVGWDDWGDSGLNELEQKWAEEKRKAGQ
ncbi:hypothetical protein TrST_g7386 [Triparma strigata]|uniref:Uncharacterized protein n=2 Tax=Triparma strigata TaxID=1606541 RepID=A0A9W7AAT1_9STRA|nr:hypothetical protein TrST_g7386 [Triparma strigata]